MNRLPLFPLNTVLFPGGLLPLKIFEPRYLDLVSDCMRNNTGFGICLISEGQEAGEPATVHEIGTMVNIVDWERRSDGLLGILVHGERRFRVKSTRTEKNGLLVADVQDSGLVEFRVVLPLHLDAGRVGDLDHAVDDRP